MAITLYDATVPTFVQVLGAVHDLVGKAEAWCEEQGKDPLELTACRLAEDMLPFAMQVKFTKLHSIAAIEGAKAGKFGPDLAPPPMDFAGLKTMVADAKAALDALSADEVNGLVGKPVLFEAGQLKLPFTAENFLLSFSQPNFHFHATTAYGILRMKGLPLSKRNYLGHMRLAAG